MKQLQHLCPYTYVFKARTRQTNSCNGMTWYSINWCTQPYYHHHRHIHSVFLGSGVASANGTSQYCSEIYIGHIFHVDSCVKHKRQSKLHFDVKFVYTNLNCYV